MAASCAFYRIGLGISHFLQSVRDASLLLYYWGGKQGHVLAST